MKLSFVKYHGSGNDFIIISESDLRESLRRDQIAALCHRRLGIGADGLMVFAETAEADFRMTYYNSDGLEGSMCGNGGRCITAYAATRMSGMSFRFMATDGLHHSQVLSSEGDSAVISLEMANVPVVHRIGEDFFLDTGSPHLVRFVDNPDTIAVDELGRYLRYHGITDPGGTNVNFAAYTENTLYVRTYERGVEEETLSCGTGVTAVAMAAALKYGGREFQIRTRGGQLKVSFIMKGERFTDVVLTGPAVKVFSGEINI